MVENWLFEQYEMRNNIFIIKITHVIFAMCYYSPSGQYLETGWVNRLSRPLNRFLPGGNRLNRYKNRLNRFWPPCRQSARSLRCQFRSLRCQTARNFAQSTPFSARFYCAVWPETGWTGFETGWTGCWDHASSPKVLQKETASAEAARTWRRRHHSWSFGITAYPKMKGRTDLKDRMIF